MPFATYAELQAEIIGFLGDRTDLILKVPSFVALCEENLNARLRCREQHERALALLTERFEYLPANFAAVDYIKVQDGKGGEVRAKYRTMQQLDSEWHNKAAVDLPCAFSIIGTQIRFAPAPTPFVIPDGVDPDLEPAKCRNFEIGYWTKVAPLTAPESFNVVLTTYPSLYLFGSLLEAEPYLAHDERVQLWGARFESAIKAANEMDANDTKAAMQISSALGDDPP
jgi:hypothetical protein